MINNIEQFKKQLNELNERMIIPHNLSISEIIDLVNKNIATESDKLPLTIQVSTNMTVDVQTNLDVFINSVSGWWIRQI